MTGEQILTTKLNRKWVWKMWVFFVALVILAVWGALDAWWVYPAKGREHAEFITAAYLERLAKDGLLLRASSVEDPAAVHAELAGKRDVGADSVDAARLVWLTSLSRIHDLKKLSAENAAKLAARKADPSLPSVETPTIFSDPRKTLDDLTNKWKGKGVPSPLSAYDIPMQYVFVVVGALGALWLLYFIRKCSATRYSYDSVAKKLTLPDGSSFTPDDITGFSKRDWHKYYLYFTLKDRPGETKFDLLRFTPLEDWVEEMRRLRPGFDPAEDEKPKDEKDAGADGGSGGEAGATGDGGDGDRHDGHDHGAHDGGDSGGGGGNGGGGGDGGSH